MDKKLERYVGARPFETENQLIFRGRQADTEGVFRLIQLENLVVLYGKSGTGKSSLLNAGIIPKVKLETELDPIRLRFNAYKEGNTFIEPLESARLTVRGNVPSHTTFLDKLIPDEATLWHDVKEHYIRHKGERGLLLVIDQFEELFTYPPESVNAFQEQLAEALFKTVPQRYWDILQEQFANGKRLLNPEELTLLQNKPALKIVLSIRSDRLHLLNRMDAQLPTILKNLYELDALSDAAARQAIQEPAAMMQMDVFDTPPFLYASATLDYILDFLTHEKNTVSEADDAALTVPVQQKIEATQLQIICNAVEKKAKANNLQMVQVADVGNLEVIIEQYYENQIQSLELSEQLPARRLIEEGLVFEEEERRLSIYEGQIFKTYKIKPDTLRRLVDSHLLRAEPSLSGGYTYELSHDTLVAPVLKAKNKRLEEEKAVEAVKAAQELKSELAEAHRKAEMEKQRRNKATLLSIASFIGLLVAVWFYFDAKNAKLEAENAKTRAELLQKSAEEAQLSAEISKLEAFKSLENANKQKAIADSAKSNADKQRDNAERKTREANAALAKVKIAEAETFIQSAKRLKSLDRPEISLIKQILDEAEHRLEEARQLDPSNPIIEEKQAAINRLKN
jgi:hypothetical protein